MPNFAFHGRNRNGEIVSGTRAAPDQRQALESLRDAGFFVTQLAPASAKAPAAKTPAAKAPAAKTPGAENALLVSLPSQQASCCMVETA